MSEQLNNSFAPPDESKIETMFFSNEQTFQDWYEAEASQHASWVKKTEYLGQRTMIEGNEEFNAKW